MKKAAFGYLRVSGLGQVERDGFPRQRAVIEAFAKAHDIRIVRWFQEEGVCGETAGEDRPAWSAMLDALETNGTKTIIIERLDRLARKLMIQEALLESLKKNGFEIISATEPDLGAEDETRTLIRQVLGAVAQYEKARIVTKLRAARERKRNTTGRCEGRKVYGAKPGEDAIIRRITTLAAQDRNYTRIARTLNAEGARSRMGKMFYPMTVRNILRRTAV